MALKFYKQTDIENMLVDEVPEDFVAYFNKQSEARKKEIITTRPDLAIVLRYKIEGDASEQVIESEKELTEEESIEESQNRGSEDSEKDKEDIFSEIRNNIYE